MILLPFIGLYEIGFIVIHTGGLKRTSPYFKSVLQFKQEGEESIKELAATSTGGFSVVALLELT